MSSMTLEGAGPDRNSPAAPSGKQGFLSPDEIEIVRSFVWQGCTDAELRFGLSVCQFLGLNPLLKHVIFIKNNQNAGTIYTTRDGLLHMAHQSGQFNGMQSGVQYARNKEGEVVRQNGRKLIEGAWCKVYRKDMDYPFEVEVNFEEYNRPRSQVWQQYPAAMIKKVAEHMTLKLAFNVSGLASVEEIGMEEAPPRPLSAPRGLSAEEQAEREKQQEKQAQATMKILIETIRQLQQRYGLTKEEIQGITQRDTLRGLTIKELETVILLLNNHCMNRQPLDPTQRQAVSAAAEEESFTDPTTETDNPEPPVAKKGKKASKSTALVGGGRIPPSDAAEEASVETADAPEDADF